MKELLKEAIDKIYWVDKNEPFIQGGSYPSQFECKFGNISTSYIGLKDCFIDLSRVGELHKFLTERGFNVVKQGSLINYKTGNYFNEELLLQLSVEFFDDRKRLDKDKKELEDDFPYVDEDDKTMIAFCPLESNKTKLLTFFKDMGKSNLWKVRKEETKKFFMIAEGRSGLYKQETSFKNIEIKDGRYDIYYGKNFPHEKFTKFVNEETENLLLLHGDPGTGKSNYIKNLIIGAERDVIYIPPSMMGVISSPGFVSFMSKNKNNILLIEDAEEILSSDRNAATNNLLGLTDGFLKDSLNLKIICTFNCDLKRIDEALKRKGRLYFEYKFDKLTVEECRDLADFAELDIEVTEPMSLAEVFNYDKEISLEDSFEERQMGFHSL